jgi:hypothetical protein
MIFNQTDYRKALKTRLIEKKSAFPDQYSYQTLAAACKIQKTYLSRFFRGLAHLNADQMFLASDFLDFNSKEQYFLRLLHEIDRSTIEKRRLQLLQELRKIQQENTQTGKHLQAKESIPSDPLIGTYFLDPLMHIVHMFLTIDSFRKQPKLIANSLSISSQQLSQILEHLDRMGLIKCLKNDIKVLKDNLHLPSQSQYAKPFRMLIRNLAMGKTQNITNEDGYFFSAVFSADQHFINSARNQFNNFIPKIEKQVLSGQIENVYQMHIDLFKWG